MQVIGTVGLAGSGKGEVATVAAELDVPVVTMGDVVRQACRDRGLDPAEHHGNVAQALREEEGRDAIAQRSLPLVEEQLADHDTVLVDGLRAGVEAERFRERFGDAFTLVHVHAPFDVRADRIADRGRDSESTEGHEALRRRDERELGFGMEEAIDDADLTVENVDSLESFHDRIRRLFAGDSPTDDQ